MIINYSDQEIIEGKKSIFLARPTPREKKLSHGEQKHVNY